MKKFLALVSVFLLCFAFVSCGGDKTFESKAEDTSVSRAGDTSDSGESGEKEVTLTLHNTTGKAFTSVFISKAGEDKWSANLITETLESFEHTDIKIEMPADADKEYKVLAKDAGGNSYYFQGLDFSELTEEGGNLYLGITQGIGYATFTTDELTYK